MSKDQSSFRSHGQNLCTLIIVIKVRILYAIPDSSTSTDVRESDSLIATTTAQFLTEYITTHFLLLHL